MYNILHNIYSFIIHFLTRDLRGRKAYLVGGMAGKQKSPVNPPIRSEGVGSKM